MKVSSVTLVILLIVEFVICIDLDFPVYHFHRKSYWGKRFVKQERHCRSGCEKENNVDSLLELKCTRLCLSPRCYKEIYEWNELEVGEIDIRAKSFKGCVAKELKENEIKEL